MADMYGAPIGILASDQNIRQNIHAGLLAQKTLGEINAQPAEVDLKVAQAGNLRALTRQHTAEAAKLEEAAASLETMRRLGQEAAAEAQAQAQAVDQARLQGVDLTAADRPAGGFSRRPSAAEPLERLYDLGQKKGVPLDLLMPYAKKAADIRKEEAQTASANAEAEVRTLKAASDRAERMGALAQHAMKGPREYAIVRAQMAQEGLPVNALPASFEEALPGLRQLEATSVGVKDRADLLIKERTSKAAEVRAQADSARAGASVMRAKMAVKLGEQRFEAIAKNGGFLSPEARANAEEQAIRRRQLTDKELRKEFPPAPLDPAARVNGKSYTAADGRTRFLWTKDPASGNMVAVVIEPNSALAAKSPRAPRLAAKDEADFEDD